MDEDAQREIQAFSRRVSATPQQKAAFDGDLLKRDQAMISATQDFVTALAEKASAFHEATWTCGFGTAAVQSDEYTSIKIFISCNMQQSSVIEVNYLEERCGLRVDGDYKPFDRTKPALYKELSRAFLKAMTR